MERTEWRLVANDLEKAFASIAKTHGVTFQMQGWRYSDTECLYKVRATVTKVNGKKFDPNKEEWKRYASMYGFKVSDLGREFEFAGKTYTVVGIKPKRRRYPVVGKDVSTGRTFKFSAASVCAAMRAGS